MSYELTEWMVENIEDIVSILTGYGDNLLPLYVATFAARNLVKLVSLK